MSAAGPGPFVDRLDAGRQLAQALARWRGQHPLVLAIPRGGVPLGRVVAQALAGELDVVLARKIGAPHNPEYAVGAVDESGWIWRNPEAGDDPALRHHLATEAARQLDLIRQRRVRYTPGRTPADPAGRVVIVVDDGLATGATMIAALHALRGRQPARLVCAVPVAPADVDARLAGHADELVCLRRPADFMAVGAHYRHFDAVEDEEVERLLRERPC